MRSGIQAAFAKDARALLPALAAFSALLVALTFDVLQMAGAHRTSAYFIATALLGAMPFGQEFGWRTLGALMALPIPRATIVISKFASLTLALLLLAGVAWFTVLAPASLGGLRDDRFDLVTLPVVLALCVAPWFTLLTRSTLGGAVFSLTAGAGVLLGADILANWRYELYDPSAAPFQQALVRAAWFTLSVVGAVATWRRLRRLEVLDAPDAHLAFRWWPERSGTDNLARRRRSAMRALVGKELRLQQLALALAGLYVLAWALMIVFIVERQGGHHLMGPLTTLYMVLVATVAGASASADERQLGTLQSDLLVPISHRRRWTTKAAVALLTALVLAVALPLSLGLLGVWGAFGYIMTDVEETPVIALLVCVAALYSSSLSRSAMRALIGTALVAAAAPALTWIIIGPAVVVSETVLLPLLGQLPLATFDSWIVRRWLPPATLFVAAGLAIVLAGRNHRTLELPRPRVARQVAMLVVVAMLGSLVGESLRYAAVAQRRAEAERARDAGTR